MLLDGSRAGLATDRRGPRDRSTRSGASSRSTSRARRRRFELPLDWALIGPFARRVLSAHGGDPLRLALSYGEVAAEAGSPRGARAAGNALGSNPIPIVIPCHRVLHAGGGLGGYGGGLERKRWLLELEGALSRARRASSRGARRGERRSSARARRLGRPAPTAQAAGSPAGISAGVGHLRACRAGTTRRRARPDSRSRRP